MATAIALDPRAELEHSVDRMDGMEPIITVADDMALVSFRLSSGVMTEVWLRSNAGWRLHGTHGLAG